MTRRKKNGFLTFCFSLLPGAAEMYMGFMKMGISLMGIFFGLLAITAFLGIGLGAYIAMLVWFYAFFHAHNLAGLSDMEFANLQDEYLFNFDAIFNLNRGNMQKYRKVIAAILIVIGAVMLWRGLTSICYEYLPEAMVRVLRRVGYTVPQIVVGAGIIMGGFYMIKGKKEELEEVIIDMDETEQDTNAYGTVDMTEETGKDEEHSTERKEYGTEADSKNA